MAGAGAVLKATHGAILEAGGYAELAGAAALPAVAVAVAGLAGYVLGTAIQDKRLSVQERQGNIDQAYRVARRRLADQFGRNLTKAELKPLTDAWQRASAMNAGAITSTRAGHE